VFSITTEYALRAAVCLCEGGERFHTSRSVAQSAKVSEQYMSKVLHHLAAAGVAHSQRGPSGGFALSRDPSTITLLDVVQAVEPVERIRVCPLGLPEHAGELCPLHKAMDDVARTVREMLSAKTLADLVTETVRPLGITIRGRAAG
jgi:Rrf2 family transcriptional regulator, nitric oxide-sensitive transcriptional repressor